MTRRKAKEIVEDLDDVVGVLTGRGIAYWGKKAWDGLRTKWQEGEVSSENGDDPYAVLGLDPNCIPADIIGRYRELAKKYHPDGSEPNEKKFKHIQKAYEKLCLERNIR